MPSTIFTQNIHEIMAFFKKNKKVILKPIHGYSGNDIHLLTRFISNLVKRFIKKNGHIMCQKYLPKISNGDKIEIVQAIGGGQNNIYLPKRYP